MTRISRVLFTTISALLLGAAGYAETAGVLLDLDGSSSQTQSFSPYAENWQSVGKGQLIASGSHHFGNKWVQGPNGRFWKNDEDPYKDPATHSEQEVAEDVLVHKGQVVVQGPGSIGYAYKFRGLGHAYMQEPGAPANIIPQGLGGLTMAGWMSQLDEKPTPLMACLAGCLKGGQ